MKRKLTRPLSDYTTSELWRAADHNLISELDVLREIERRLHLVADRRERA